MNFDEFENKARLYVVGALEAEEMDEFVDARREFGDPAEEFINECRKLNAIFALSLRPHAPHPGTKLRLLEQIREAMRENGLSSDDGESEF